MASDVRIDMLRPPIARGMRVLDRALFQKTVPLKAARIFDNKSISKVRWQLERSKDSLPIERLGCVRPDPDPVRSEAGKKCVLLDSQANLGRAGHKCNGTSEDQINNSLDNLTLLSRSPVLSELVAQEVVSIIPYDLRLDYTHWSYHDIISAILPLDAQDEIPSGFSQVGHVAHLNLRDEYLPYKYIIAEILMDKNPGVRTVINKIDDVGEENEYRTFKYEVLAGPDDLNVTISEANCVFVFDYSKVYWNARLSTEHKRLVDMFKEGDAVCDVMAGIGPFAVPAGKKGVFVWANDLNPDSFTSLQDAITRNKVTKFVRSFNTDGRGFIKSATAQLLDTNHRVDVTKKRARNDRKPKPLVLKTLAQPKVFQHFVLNLPASALTFLPSFIGIYPPELRSKLPRAARMPIIHVFCFSTKDEFVEREQLEHKREVKGESDSTKGAEDTGAAEKICALISQQLEHPFRPGNVEGDDCVEVYDVRDVAPNKRMFCASFRLPEAVAFRTG